MFVHLMHYYYCKRVSVTVFVCQAYSFCLLRLGACELKLTVNCAKTFVASYVT
jgi:hypothetical protein